MNTLIEFMILSIQAIVQRIVYKLISDKHSFLKKKPKNVFINELNSKNLTTKFDIYLPNYETHKIEKINLISVEYCDSNDIEVYYAENRLSYCINALFENPINTAFAVENALSWIKSVPGVILI